MVKKDMLLPALVGLVVGGAGGFLLGSRASERPAPAPPPAAAAPAGTAPGDLFPGLPAGGAQAAAPVPAAPAAPAAIPDTFALEQAVVQDPNNFKAWVTLGNVYFDSHQPQKAVEAYAKALALEPNNPDILTDQGVMYRDLRDYPKALAAFEKAQKLNPAHIQSLFNLGVVYAHDVHQPAKAEKAWKRLIEVAPASPQAAQAKAGLERLKGPAGP